MKIEKRYYVLLGVIIALLIASIIALVMTSGDGGDPPAEKAAETADEAVAGPGGASSPVKIQRQEDEEDLASEVSVEDDWEEGTYQEVTVQKENTAELAPMEWEQAKQQLMSHIQRFEFNEAYGLIEQIYRTADTGKENGEEIEAWNYSLSLLLAISGEMHGHEMMAAEQSATVQGMTIPELALAGTMAVPDDARVMLIADGTSKFPLYADDDDQTITIGTAESYAGVEVDSLSDEGVVLRQAMTYIKSEDPANVYRLPFKMDGVDMLAVLVKNESGEYRVFHIITPEDVFFQTVQFWRSYYETLAKGRK